MPIEGLKPKDIELDSIRDSTFWFVVNPETDEYVATPDSKSGYTLVLFLKKDDAEHWAYVLVNGMPAYKGKSLVVYSDAFQEVFEYSLSIEDMRILALGPTEAKKLFEEYPEFMPHYYGIENEKETDDEHS